MMEIRLTELKDLPLVMEIYDYARAFMRANGALHGKVYLLLIWWK